MEEGRLGKSANPECLSEPRVPGNHGVSSATVAPENFREQDSLPGLSGNRGRCSPRGA